MSKKYSLKSWIQDTAKSSEELIYQDIIQHEQYGSIVHESSKRLHVYRNLKSMIQPLGRKGDLLRLVPYSEPTNILIDHVSPLNVSMELINTGYSPLTMCTTVTEQVNPQCKMGRLEQEDMLFLRTTMAYPLRSHKYRNIVKSFLYGNGGAEQKQNNNYQQRQCMSTFLPNLLLFRNDHKPVGENKERFMVLPWNQCRYLNVGLVSGCGTLMHLADDAHATVIKAKLNCLFDMALDQRDGYSGEGYLDSLVLSDLYCRTPKHISNYVQALKDLLPSYMHHFRMIVLAIDRNDDLLNALRVAFATE